MNLLTDRIDGHGKTLDLLAQRQKVLAGNIANADTPGFKARDFDFAKALQAARSGAVTQPVLAATAARHLSTGSAGAAEVLWRTPEQPALDGNTVDLDSERAAFADNALRYEATLRFIGHDVRTLLSAITGQ